MLLEVLLYPGAHRVVKSNLQTPYGNASNGSQNHTEHVVHSTVVSNTQLIVDPSHMLCTSVSRLL